MTLEILATRSSASLDLVAVWHIKIELGPEDDDSLRDAINTEVGLAYGEYDHVSFETAEGTQYFRGHTGTASGQMDVATSRYVRVLAFSIPRNEQVLRTVLDLIDRLHSYEEPVVYVQEAYATRRKAKADNRSPRKWWNRHTDL